MTNALQKQVFQFWFKDLTSATDAVPSSLFRLWFTTTKETDDYITAEFGTHIQSLLQDPPSALFQDLTSSRDSKQTLTAILLLDQFTRNAYRNTPQAFAGDTKALDLARALVTFPDFKRDLLPVHRVFAYLPFEHAEDLGCQRVCVEASRALAEEAKGTSLEPVMQGFLKYALVHQELIERFGRFPHRNALLGRVSTAEEEAYLLDGGETFGQKK